MVFPGSSVSCFLDKVVVAVYLKKLPAHNTTPKSLWSIRIPRSNMMNDPRIKYVSKKDSWKKIAKELPELTNTISQVCMWSKFREIYLENQDSSLIHQIYLKGGPKIRRTRSRKSEKSTIDLSLVSYLVVIRSAKLMEKKQKKNPWYATFSDPHRQAHIQKLEEKLIVYCIVKEP